MEGIGANNMVTVLFGIRDVHLIKDMLGALAVERQLFAPFQHRLIIVVQLVFGFAQGSHVLIHPRHQHKSPPDGDCHPDCRHQQHFGRQHRQIRRRSDGQDNPLHQLRQTNKGDGDVANIAG